MAQYENILVEQRGAVTLITLNRPKALNALNTAVLGELIAAYLGRHDIDVVVETRGDRAQRVAALNGIAGGRRRSRAGCGCCCGLGYRLDHDNATPHLPRRKGSQNRHAK